MKKKILYGILIIFLLLFSFSFGLYLGSKKPVKVVEVEKETVKVLEPKGSKLVEKRYFNIRGILSEISGRTITLTKDGETIKIPIVEDAPVTSYVWRIGEPPLFEGPKSVDFDYLKVRDEVAVFVEERENGELVGTNVYIHFTMNNF